MRGTIRWMPVLVVLLAGAACADPFDKEWNWENQKLNGKVKSVLTEEAAGKRLQEFDKQGRKVAVTLFDERGKETHKVKIGYNDDGDPNKVTFTQVGLEGPLYVEKADYKSKGIIHAVTRTLGEMVTKSKPFVYDKKDRLKEISMEQQGKLTTWAYRFNKRNELIEFELRHDGKTQLRAVYENYVNGAPTIMKSYHGSKLASFARVSYKFDSNKNWTERKAEPVLYRDGKKIERDPHVTKRKIEYYK
jgi:hypothetical protein